MLSYLPQLALINSDSALQFHYEPVSPPGDPVNKCPSLLGLTQCCSSLSVPSFSYDEPKQ